LKKKYIDVNDLLKNLSFDELQRSAEGYFSQLKDHSFQLSKPFNHLDECPVLITWLAKLIQGGYFLPQHKVLEFGSGSCWLGRLFNQLGMEVVSLDISKTALDIGKKLKAQSKVFGIQPEHKFLLYDGEKINEPNNSFDRVVCFESFHHVNDQSHTLSEFYRVLRPGGIVAFCEPGPFHSKNYRSQEEMKNYNVIENDIKIERIWKIANSIGFKNIYFTLAMVDFFSLNFKSYMQFQRNSLTKEHLKKIINSIENTHKNLTIFFIQKGKRVVNDSRDSKTLSAKINIIHKKIFTNENKSNFLSIKLKVQNTGNSNWLPSGNNSGSVNIGVHLFDENRKLIDLDYFRYEFSKKIVKPKDKIIFLIDIPLNKSPYKSILEIDLVSEKILWFAMNGSETIKLFVDSREYKLTTKLI
jgi:ubiquinone/menaquinone biosynthesis C-methylase UbiE